MRKAHSNSYVRTIVDILLQHRDLLEDIADVLQTYEHRAQIGLAEDLETLRINQRRQNLITPPHVIELTDVLHKLYQQPNENIKHQRGAIVELLARKIICPRYGKDEFCLNNQRFFDKQGNPITVKEVDVAALSHIRSQVEGYECKIKTAGFESYDCINLENLVDAAHDQDYNVNVGFFSLDKDTVMTKKLRHLQPPPCINLYGLDSLEKLEKFSF